MYNLIYEPNGLVLNKEPLTLEEAKYKQGLIIINYGYKPNIVKISDII